MALTLEQRQGFLNRHTNGLPKEKCVMKIVTKDVDGEHIIICEWKPFDKAQYTEKNMPGYGYLGSAIVIEERYNGIGFHVWKENDYEFVYYKVLYMLLG